MYKPLSSVYPEVRVNNPLAVCLADDMERSFLFGATVSTHSGPRSSECQEYMLKRCSKNWDEYCDIAYEKAGPNYTPVYKPDPHAAYFRQEMDKIRPRK